VAPCKKLFRKKDRRAIPELMLGDGLTGHEGSQVLKPVKTVRDAQGDKLYISWDKSEKTLRIENQDGVKPMIESPIVKFEAYSEGGYFLTYSPSWKMVRGGAKAGSKE
jgi:hypothetical protein